MEIRLMEYVCAVAEHKSFTKAALQLCITQPSLSQQIAKLERELGVLIFLRGNGTVELTREGEHFLKKAERILLLHDELSKEMKDFQEGSTKSLVIGTTAITGGHVLPVLLRNYHRQYPKVQIQLVEDSTDVIVDLTKRGKVDISILSLPINNSSLSVVEMITEPLFLVLSQNESNWLSGLPSFKEKIAPSMSSDSKIDLKWFAKAPFILLKKGFRFRDLVEELCVTSGFKPNVVFETSSIETAQSLASHGLGITLVPEMVAQYTQPPIPQYLRLVSEPTRTLVFAYRHGYLSQAARDWISLHKATMSAIVS